MAVALGFVLRLALTAWVGPGLPTYITFYPAVMAVALLEGIGPGLAATALTDLVATYWLLPPIAQFVVASPVDRLGLVVFSLMGLFMSVVAELFRRSRDKAAAYDRDAALRESRERLATFAEATFEGILESEAGRVVDCNEQLARMLGYSAAELKGVEIANLIAPEDRERVMANVWQGRESAVEHAAICKDGTRIIVETHGRPVSPGSAGATPRSATSPRANRPKSGCGKPRRNGNRHSTPSRTLWPSSTIDTASSANRPMAERLGVTPEQCVGLRCYEAVHGTTQPPEFCPHEQTCRDGREHTAEVFETRLGGHFLVSTTPRFDEQGRLVGAVHVARDINRRKHDEEERAMAAEFLRLVNESRGKEDLIRAAVTFFQEKSGCEAVGVRLKDGDDYPYYETRGFPREFVLLENRLCARDDAGQTIRDAAGNPLLDCMCGNVICGRFDPSQPFFTARGSFWTNCTTELLASTTEADRQARTRNRCNGEGYESVALIALTAGEDCFGLLQLNDRRKGCFTAEGMALWERLAGYLGVALAKTLAESTLQDTLQRFYRILQHVLRRLTGDR